LGLGHLNGLLCNKPLPPPAVGGRPILGAALAVLTLAPEEAPVETLAEAVTRVFVPAPVESSEGPLIFIVAPFGDDALLTAFSFFGSFCTLLTC
jgi:hypothetical protein